ncbi:PRC-barrel domain-containing protein [Rhodocyclaceae bacterium SMB388]
MNMKLSRVLIVGAIAAMSAAPLWAASHTVQKGTDAATSDAARATDKATKTDLGQPTRAEERTMGATSGAAVDQHAMTSNYRMGDTALYALSADELDGMEVVDRVGDKVGTIKSIVLAPDRKSAHAVITAGGFLGMGARHVLVSLSDLRQAGDVLQISATKEQIVALQDYSADPYVELKGDDPIGVSFVEFSAFESGKDLPQPRAQAAPGSETGQAAREQQAAGQAAVTRAQMRSETRAATAGSGAGDNPLYTRSAANLNGVEVVDAEGETFGKITRVVLAPARNSAYAVVSAGGLLGMGARNIMLSLDELTPVDDKLQLHATKEQIDALKDYTPAEYVEIKGGTPISGSIVDFSAFEAGKDATRPKSPKAQ